MKKEIKPVYYLAHKCTSISGINLQTWRVWKTAELLYGKDTPEYFESIEEGKVEYTLKVCELCANNGWKIENNFDKIDKEMWKE